MNNKLEQRNYHISTDKLGVTFEKQFLSGLPDLGECNKNDAENNSKSKKQKNNLCYCLFGKNKKNKNLEGKSKALMGKPNLFI